MDEKEALKVVSRELFKDLWEVMEKYNKQIPTALAVGVVEMFKQSLIHEIATKKDEATNDKGD